MYLSKITSAMSKARKNQYMQKRYVHNFQRYTLFLDVSNVQVYKSISGERASINDHSWTTLMHRRN